MTRPISADAMLTMLTVAECGSINRAAEVLHVSQPSLTRSVRDFEGRLGEKVFERGAKGVELTPLGRTLMERARAVRLDMRRAQDSVERFRRDRRQIVRLGAVSVQPIQQFSQAVVAIARQFPEVHLSFVTGTQDEMLHALHEGRIEVLFGRLLNEADFPHLRQEVLYHDEAHVYCRAGHALAHAESVSVADLAACDWVLGPPGSMMRARVDELFTPQRQQLRVSLEVEDVLLRRALVKESDLLSAFQVHHALTEVAAGLMARLPVQLDTGVHPIGAISLTDYSPFALELIRNLAETYRKAGIPGPAVAPDPAPELASAADGRLRKIK
jgi:DNA-binding transcriptional LysR family regulator